MLSTNQAARAPIISALFIGSLIALIASTAFYHMEEWFGLFLTQIILLVAVFTTLAVTFGPISLPTVIVFIFSLYALSAGVDSYFYAGSRYSLPHVSILSLLNNYFLFLYTLFLITKQKTSRNTELPRLSENCQSQFLLATCVICGGYFFAVYITYGTLTPALSRSDIFLQKGTLLQILKILAPVFATVLIVASLQTGNKFRALTTILVTAPYLFTELFVFGDRRLVLCMFIIVMIAFNERRNANFRSLLGIALILVSFLAIGNSRNRDYLSFVDQIPNLTETLNFSTQEFGYTPSVVENLDASGYLEPRMFSVLDIPLQIVPKFVAPGIDRPLAPSLIYARDFHPLVFYNGGAFGYSLIIESFQNAHILGVGLLAAAFAFLTVYVHSRSNSRMQFCLQYAVPFTLIFSARMDLISVIKQVTTAALGLYIAIFVIDLLARKKALARSPSTPYSQ